MDKENKPQPDSLSVSTISNGGYSYETPPPAYSTKKSTTIALARIAATTILVAAFILGAFIVAGSYVSALTKCNCPQEQHQLPQTASLVGINAQEKQDVLTKPEETPAKIIEKQATEEQEVKVPIAITTTEAPEIDDEENPLEPDETSETETSEEAPEEPDIQQKIMNLLQKMLEIDPTMKGNMKCKVSKHPHPFNPDGKPLLQVHCKKATTMQIIKPFGNPFNPLSPISRPRIFRMPGPLPSSGIVRVQKPMFIPTIRRILPPSEPQLPFLQKPVEDEPKMPLIMKLAQLPNALNQLRPSLNEPEQRFPPRFPIFPHRSTFLNGPALRPKLRFIVPIKSENQEPPFRKDFPDREIPRFDEDYSDEHPHDHEDEHEDSQEEEDQSPQFPLPIFRPYQQRLPVPFNFQPKPFSKPEPENEPELKIPEKHLMPPTGLQQEEHRPSYYPPPTNDDTDEENSEPSFLQQQYPPFSSPPEYKDEEEETPNVEEREEPQGPIAIPLKRTESEQQQPFPFTHPRSLLERIRNLQNIPPRLTFPRT